MTEREDEKNGLRPEKSRRWEREAERVRSQQHGLPDWLSRQWWMYAIPVVMGLYISLEDSRSGASPVGGLVVAFLFSLPLAAKFSSRRRK